MYTSTFVGAIGEVVRSNSTLMPISHSLREKEI